jgi:hypothetical protein
MSAHGAERRRAEQAERRSERHVYVVSAWRNASRASYAGRFYPD